MSEERCICCGKEIPEGRQVCVICGFEARKNKPDTHNSNVEKNCENCAYYDTGWTEPPCCSCRGLCNWEESEVDTE